MDRNTILWTVAVFFGATVMFGVIRNATEDQSTALSLGLQVLAGVVLVGVIVLVLRSRR